MKKLILVFMVFLILLAATLFVQKYFGGGKLFFYQKVPIVKIDGHSFRVTVANSQQERETGLSGIQSLSQNQGMIFIFEKPDYYKFWMKDMKFPIDIIYIKNDTIVTIKNDVQAPKNNQENLTIYAPTEPSDRVLEIQAGLAKTYKFKAGDKVTTENL